MQRRKSADDRKAEIVSALLRLADEVGPDRLTTNDIARVVGLTQAAIFRHFPTKAELWLAVGEEISNRLGLAWETALASSPSPEARLRALIGAQFHQIEICPALPSILFSRELNVDNPPLREVFRGLLMRFQGHLVSALTEMRDRGGFRDDLPPEDAAVLLTSLVQGLAIRWSLGARGFPLAGEGMRLLDCQLALLRP